MATLIQLIPISGNAKTGPMPVASSCASTCPPSCGAFYNCYAKFGPCAIHWKALNEANEPSAKVHEPASFYRAVRAMMPATLWRMNEKGDLPGIGNDTDSEATAALVAANKGKRGFTYTHKPVFSGTYTVTGKPGQGHTSEVSEATALANRATIAACNAGGFTVNLSADSLADCDRKASLGIGPVCVILPSEAAKGGEHSTPEGRKIVTCPAALDRNDGKGFTCTRCALCQRSNRTFIIGFPAHGTAKKRADAAAK